MASSPRSTVFRVSGLPLGKAEEDVKSQLLDKIGVHRDNNVPIEVGITCVPSCDGDNTLTALVEFKNVIPDFLSELQRDPLREYQIEMDDDDISFDRHFFGFTQLYPTDPSQPVTADIIAITGLDGHAYGSWRGKGNLGRMWLRDFLCKDLPNCRTMIYGYNSKMSSHGTHKIIDYGRSFLEGIKRVRYTQELRERPLFFIAHSFGGIILAHCLIKATQATESDHAAIASLHKATYGILFFGTPHKGLIIDDIQQMLAEESHNPRGKLLEQIQADSDILEQQLADFRNLIRDRKIVTFYERQQTKRLEKDPKTGQWSRSGAYITAVDSGSALLHLPDSIEEKIPVDADHSRMVKFDTRRNETYKTAIAYLKQFEKNAKTIVSGRFSRNQRNKEPLSTVPFARDPKFVGREDILQELEARFISSPIAHNRVVLVGLGGVGKSQIAIEYSYRLQVKDPMIWVFWVSATSFERFEHDYKSIATILELPGWDDPKTDVLALVLRWLCDTGNGRWLMVLDNADDIDILYKPPQKTLPGVGSSQVTNNLISYIPQTETGWVLVTSRNRSTGDRLSMGYSSIIEVEVMKPSDAEHLLSITVPAHLFSKPEASQLVEALDFLPLAITQAAAYISGKASHMSVSGYLMLYSTDETSQSRLLDYDNGDLRRDSSVLNSVIRTWQISFDQIKRAHPKAAALLSLMAMFDCQAIPKLLLRAEYPDTLDFEEALSPIEDFSLVVVEQGGESFTLHRLVQLATRKWLTLYNEVENWQGHAIEILSQTFPSGDYDNWKVCEMLWPHAQEVLKYNLVSTSHLVSRSLVLYNMAWCCWFQGQFVQAIEQGQKSLLLREQVLEAGDVRILDSIAIVGLAFRSQGKYTEAEVMSRRALAGYEAAFGLEHPDTLTSTSSLARVLQSQGKYTEAEVMHRRVLAGREAALGLEHPNTLMSTSSLATVLQSQGKYTEAEAMNRRVLAGHEAMLGPEHPDTLMSINNLSGVLQLQGKYTEVEAMMRRVLVGCKATLGTEHPNTLASTSNLAMALQMQGKYNEAETMHRWVLAVREDKLGAEHPDTLMSVYCLAYLQYKQGLYPEARLLYQRVNLGFEKVLGPEHPTTIVCRKNSLLLPPLLHPPPS